MAEMDRIAVIIEDDPDIRRLLEDVLEQGGFETHSAANGLDGIEKVRRHRPVLTTLDVSMPGIDGFETAKRIRTFSDTYLIMLTARNEEIDTLIGLESGADDYVVKPFRPRELRARVDAMLRRPRTGTGPIATPVTGDATPPADPALAPPATAPSPTDTPAPTAAPEAQPGPDAPPSRTSSAATAPPDADDGWLEHRGLRLHPEMRLTDVDGTPVDLTRSEFDLLALIVSSRRRVRSKADLALALRGESYVTSYYVSDADKRAVEVHLANLRRKLGESAAQPRWIETVRGVGYRLTADDMT